VTSTTKVIHGPGVPECVGGSISVEPYHSEESFKKERDHIFRKCWLNVCRTRDVPEPDSYFVRDLAMIGTSILVMRGEDGVIRAFHNVCAHRLNKVVWNESGACPKKGIQCTFHGWRYKSDGKLAGAPDRAEFPNFDASANGLTPIDCETWNGFVFINLDPQHEVGLREYLGEFGDILEEYPFEKLVPMSSYRIEIEANWKVVLDAFSEGYHVPFTHGPTLPDFIDTSLYHMHQIGLFERHHYGSTPANPDSLYSNSALPYLPLDPKVEEARPEMERIMSAFSRSNPAPEFHPDRLPEGVNPTKTKRFGFDLWTCFPNVVAIVSSRLMTHHFWPISPTRTVLESKIYAPDVAGIRDYLFHQFRNIVIREAVREDVKNPEETQRVLDSGARSHMLLSRQEALIQHFAWVRSKYVDSASEGNPTPGTDLLKSVAA